MTDETAEHDQNEGPTGPLPQAGGAELADEAGSVTTGPSRRPDSAAAPAAGRSPGRTVLPEVELPEPEGRTEFSTPSFSSLDFGPPETSPMTGEPWPALDNPGAASGPPETPAAEPPADSGPADPPWAASGSDPYAVPDDWTALTPPSQTPVPEQPDVRVAPNEPSNEPAADSYEPSSQAPRAAWEGSLFDGTDSGPGVPGYAPVEMSGPSTPPKPGKPSSGNWRMPEWIGDEEDEKAGKADKPGKPPKPPKAAKAPKPDRATGHSGDGHSRVKLFAGVGLLAVALVAAAGVYLLKPGNSSVPPADNTGNTNTTPTTQPTNSAPQVQLPPDKAMPRFAGKPTRMLGRVNDTYSGLSYARFAAPWVVPTKKNKLGQSGWSGQQILVTERRANRLWYGQLLTGTLSPAERDAYKGPGSEKTAAVLVAQSMQARYYNFPHRTRPLASQALNLGGRQGWLVSSYLTYNRPGIRATGEVIVVAVINTGRRTPAVVFAAVPNTHRKLWPDLNAFITQLRVVTPA